MVDLYEHQRLAVDQLKSGSILCGGVGSGKSRTALAYFFERVCGGKYTEPFHSVENPRDLYIITTAQKRDKLEWEKECSVFQLTSYPQHDWLGINVKIDSWNNIQKYCNVCGAFFIFDEDRVVGSGAWVKAFYQITKKNKWILLSATPGDCWKDYIPVFVANGFYKNKTEFCREHVIYRSYSKYPQIDRYVGVRKLMKLRDMILVDMDYVKPTESHHVYISVDYDSDLYNWCYRNKWDVFKDEPLANGSAACYCLRRICNEHESRQLETCKVINENPRLIIFYNFDYELEILRALCAKMEVTVAEWNGHKHMPIPNEPTWVYLVQYAAGSDGWNCTQTNAMLFYSSSYSYKAMVQAAGRIDRLDTSYSDLYYYHFKCTSPIERQIDECLREKKDFNERRFVI